MLLANAGWLATCFVKTYPEADLGPLDLMNRETAGLDLPAPDAEQIARLCADPGLMGIYYAG